MSRYIEALFHLLFWGFVCWNYFQITHNQIRLCEEVILGGNKTEDIVLRSHKGENDWRDAQRPLKNQSRVDFVFYQYQKSKGCEEISFYEGQILYPLMVGNILKAVLIYGIALLLIPVFLARKKILLFLLFLPLFAAFLLGLELWLDYLYISSRHPAVYPDGFRPDNFADMLQIQLRSYPVFIFWAFMYRFAKDWWLNQKLKERLSKEKLSTELNFLKSQINPHFLFNTLNNLYGLALADKPQQSAEGIAKLSQLMRYMLYESNVEEISLEKEITYLQTYINLQKLRISEKDNIQILFETKGDFENQKIAPMLLIPFVENAFKHSLSLVNKTEIQIFLEIRKKQLFFEVTNSINATRANENNSTSGLGLQNVKRRLELLYPNRHSLEINKDENYFEVRLNLLLS